MPASLDDDYCFISNNCSLGEWLAGEIAQTIMYSPSPLANMPDFPLTTYVYPNFESIPLCSLDQCDLLAELHNYLKRYDNFTSANHKIEISANDVLLDKCQKSCNLYKAFLGAAKAGMPDCLQPFSEGIQVRYSIDRATLQTNPRKQRRNANKNGLRRSILIRDIRFCGLPVTIVLEFDYSTNIEQRKKLTELGGLVHPGSGSNKIRYSTRLAKKVSLALINNLSARYTSEASAIPLDSVKKWKKAEMRKASRILPMQLANANLCYMNTFSTKTNVQKFMAAHDDQRQPPRAYAYRFVYRCCPQASVRLHSIYRDSDWMILRGLLTRELTDASSLSHRSDSYIFNLAVDFLSDPDEGYLCDINSASPIQGAFLVLEAVKPSYDRTFLDGLDFDLGQFYHQLLLPTFAINLENLPDAIMVLKNPNGEGNHSQIQEFIRDWIASCKEQCIAKNRTLPHLCVPTSENVFECIPASGNYTLKFPLNSGIESVGELITRLLLLNPATLSTIYDSHIGMQHRRCNEAISPNGTISYADVIPGLSVDQLRYLYTRGFFTEELLRPFVDIP